MFEEVRLTIISDLPPRTGLSKHVHVIFFMGEWNIPVGRLRPWWFLKGISLGKPAFEQDQDTRNIDEYGDLAGVFNTK